MTTYTPPCCEMYPSSSQTKRVQIDLAGLNGASLLKEACAVDRELFVRYRRCVPYFGALHREFKQQKAPVADTSFL